MSVRHRERPLAVGHLVYQARDGRDEPKLPAGLARELRRLQPGRPRPDHTPRAGRARELRRLEPGRHRLDTAHLRVGADEGRDLARVSTQHGDPHLVEDPPRRVGAVRGRAGTDGIQDDGDPALARCTAGEEHRVDPVFRERADVEHERRGEPGHLLDLLPRVRHHRQPTEREGRVRRLVHDDVVRDLVDERLALTQLPQRRPGGDRHRRASPRTSTGPSPSPISASPWATARDAASAAPRAASPSESPRARSAASVAEWVQPAPWVAETSWRSNGISRCSRPSKRWSAGSSPCPPVTRAAGAPSCTSASARSSGGPSDSTSDRASSRFGVTTVASGKSRATRTSRASSSSNRAPELASMTGSTTSGIGCSSSQSATVSMIEREKSIPVFAASIPMSPATASSCAPTNHAGTSCTAVTSRVFCAVSATIADMPWTPAAANAFRSAWIPAPPPESEPAIVMQRGTNALPSPA